MAVDVPVMLLFFNRPNNLRQVFNAVKKAQPTMLFLVQDGPRDDRPEDKDKIIECREIVKNVDWNCEVFRNYSDTNLTCDHREFTGISWCFEYTDRLIILEDDCVPSESFFIFCTEMLEKYKDDARIHSICGFVRQNIHKSDYDYVFSKCANGWGWATWKRVWNKVESLADFDFLNDNYFIDSQIKNIDKSIKKIYGDFIAQGKIIKAKSDSANRIISWEYLQGMVLVLNEMLVINPTKNLIRYIGVSQDATHTPSNPIFLDRKTKKMLTQCAYEMNFPLVCPTYVVRDVVFEKRDLSARRQNRFLTKTEIILRHLIRFDFKWFLKKIKRKHE